MNKVLQNMVLPFTLFGAGILMFGCDQQHSNETSDQRVHHESRSTDISTAPSDLPADHVITEQRHTSAESHLKTGNLFYMVRDVAHIQQESNDALLQLKNAQQQLKTALDQGDAIALAQHRIELKTQLEQFTHVLTHAHLKSLEIDQMRQQLVKHNQSLLKSHLFTADVDLSAEHVMHIQQHIDLIQNGMLKLAAVLTQAKQSTTLA